ncbi:MAG: hypothetical protein IKH61_05090 [Bacteroidales bacterium]|nr:hypothetical protein [Bacteroidales bacterium]
MKKFSFILMALAMVMGMTQCKKEQTNENNAIEYEGATYQISLALSNGNGNTRADVDPDPTGAEGVARVHFAVNDSIWVAYNGVCVGALKCTELSDNTDQDGVQLGVFTGSITVSMIGQGDDAQPLYFYFLGNKKPSETTTTGSQQLTVNISDQTNELPVISYAASEQNFTGSGQYSVEYNWLMNQCALVKFETENIYNMSANTLDNNSDAIYKTTKAITIKGMANQVVVDFTQTGDDQFAWSSVDGGAITLYRPNENQDSVRYAIVHHADYSEVTAGELEVEFNPATDPYGFYGTYKIGGNVEMNDYYKDAKLDLVWHSGAFSIDAGQQVVFSRGNLQYAHLATGDRIAHTWRFAKHQYDWVGGWVGKWNGLIFHDNSVRQGNVVMNETDVNSTAYSENEQVGASTYSGWIDLFAWGTGNHPTDTLTSNHHYTEDNGFHEWGKNNIVNSGTPNNTDFWVTLSKDECVYLFENRNDANSKVGFGQIKVSDALTINGLIILPDYWNVSTYPTSTTLWKPAGTLQHSFDNNVFNSVSAWMQMEASGAVFLPAAGYRDKDGTVIDFDGGANVQQDRGTYYSCDIQGSDAAWGLGFGTASGDDLGDHINPRVGYAPDNGRSVRLVHKLSSGSRFFNKKN